MKTRKTLEDLWESYQRDIRVERCGEEKRIGNELVRSEEELLQLLGHEGKLIYDKFDNALGELHGIEELNAFIRGLRFATRYLIEVMEL